MCRFDSDCPEHGVAALLAATPSAEPKDRDADIARIAAVLGQLPPSPYGGYGYRALSAQNLATALYDAGLRPSADPG